VFENRVLRRIFGAKIDEVTGGQRKIHNEELHNLYSLPSIIRMLKSRKMKWERHIERIDYVWNFDTYSGISHLCKIKYTMCNVVILL
jgi:hypothetical protein